MTAIVVQGDARRLPLPDASVDLIVTSPPYFALRSYQDDGQHYEGQLGSETTPAAFVDALIECTREMVRVLKPSGSMFINLGDKYAAGHGGSSTEGNGVNITVRRNRKAAEHWTGADSHPSNSTAQIVPGFRPKTLIGMPWRYALRCIDDLGLILRAEIIWDKPNGLPESVIDRVRRSHEQWFHFVKQPRYYSAPDEVREPQQTADRKGSRSSYQPGQTSGNTLNGHTAKSDAGLPLNPLGKLPGSVWSIPSQPLSVPAHLGVDHFAAYPTEWPRRIMLGWSPGGICVECGEGRRATTTNVTAQYGKTSSVNLAAKLRASQISHGDGVVRSTLGQPAGGVIITGYSCACPKPDAPTRPAVVLDPFGGTGTTALVASALGRIGVTVDLSFDYSRLAVWRTSDPGERARALKVEKPPLQMVGQAELFEDFA